MSSVILRTGNYATTPYLFTKTYVNVYSVEELCYLMVTNAELLDSEIVCDELVTWLDEQCGLSQLAHSLYSLMNQNCSVNAFAGTILEHVKLYPAEVIERVESTIKRNAGLSPYEKKKAKADYMLSSGRVQIAMDQYRALCEEMPKTEDATKAKVFHNLGVCYAKLFFFAEAADSFYKAYEISGNMESLRLFLVSLRLSSRDRDYIDFISQHPQMHEVSLSIESNISSLEESFEETEARRTLDMLRTGKSEGVQGGTETDFYQELEIISASLKDRYRSYVAR